MWVDQYIMSHIIIRHIARNATGKPRSKLVKFQISTADYIYSILRHEQHRLRFNNLSSMGQLAFFGNQGLRQLALQEFGVFL